MKNLKSGFLAGVLLITALNTTSANHIHGGEFTYEPISNYTYRIHLTMYMNYDVMNGDGDWPTIDSVHMGDGSVRIFHRDYYVDIYDHLRVNYYSEVHTYPSTGAYRIYAVIPNRKGNICNIPNSFYTPFSVSADLIINQSCPNYSVTFTDLPVFYAQLNRVYTQNINILNPDHDSLSFELDTGLGELGIPIPGYTFPPQFTIDNISGEISSNLLPDTTCTYSLAVKITDWKDGLKAGSVTRDYVVVIHPDTINSYAFVPPPLPQDTGGNYFISVNPYDTVSLNIQYIDSSTFPGLNVYGEAFSVGNPAAINILSGTSITAEAQLTWVPDSTHSRDYPYIFTFRGSNDIQKTDLTVLVYVNGPKPDSCYIVSTNGIQEISIDNGLTIYPNPVSETFTIQIPEININRIEIFNTLGVKELVLSAPAYPNSSSDISINCGQLRSGIYIVRIISGNQIFYQKFIKR